MENPDAKTGKKQKNRPYLLTLRQSLSIKPHYSLYRDGMNAVCTIDGDVTRHSFSVRKDGREVLKLRKKPARLLAEYTIEKDGQEIAQIKKRISLLTHDLSGTLNGKSLEIRANFDAFRFDILTDGKKLCLIEQKTSDFSDSYEIMMFEPDSDEIAAALAVICDHVSDKADMNE